MLSPLSRLNQSIQSPTRNMDSIKKIGKPTETKEKSADDGNNVSTLAPSLFGIPSKSNCHPTGFVHCRVTRCGKNNYTLSFQAEDAEIVSIIANKVKTSRTSNYHLYDALRGGANAKLSKKAGHYIGKLRRDKDQPIGCYTLYNSSREKEQLAAYVYDIPALMSQVTEGQPPRKMQAVVPKSEGSNHEAASRDTVKSSKENNRLIEHLHNGTWKHHKLVAVQTKAPRYHEGQYRLNFSGRVLHPRQVASYLVFAIVKNMQLENENGDCLLQFGKVDEDCFHLDYKAPFTAFSAFGAALCQFDL
ncbi:hypothetical protein ACHAWF_014029 [Thalassiosira exigua]